MSPWLILFLFVVVVALAAPAAIAISAFLGWLLSFHRDICPQCGQQALRTVNLIKATILVEGVRRPDSWTYHLCESCGARLKKHRGAWKPATPDEWDRYGQLRTRAANS